MSPAWSDALRELAVRLAPTDVNWMLVGSAATALRGAAIEPGDIDVAVGGPILPIPNAIQRLLEMRR